MQALVFRHFEKGVLGLCLLFLGAATAQPIFARPAELAYVEPVLELNAFLAHHLESYSPDVPPVSDQLSSVRASVAPPAPLEAFPGWSVHRRSQLTYDILKPRPLPPSTHVAPKLEVSVAHGSATLTWARGDGNESVATSFVIRRTDAKGVAVVLRTANEPGTLVDDKVDARATYTYSVTEAAEAPVGHAPLDVKTVELTAEKSATLPVDYLIVPTKYVERDILGVPSEIQVNVYRWTPAKWVRGALDHVKVGDKLDGKVGKNQFSTGAEVLEITAEKGSATIKVRWPSGLVETLSSTDTHDELKGVRN